MQINTLALALKPEVLHYYQLMKIMGNKGDSLILI